MDRFRDNIVEIESLYYSGAVKKQQQTIIESWGDRPVLLYGAGTLSAFVMEHLKRHGISIKGFCDTYRSGVHEQTGLPILSPQSLMEQYRDAIIVITSELHEKSIMETLVKLQYPGEVYSFDDLLCFYTIPYEEFVPHIEGYKWIYEYYTDEVSKRIVVDSIKTRILGTRMTPSGNPQYFEPEICPLTGNEVFLDGGCFIGDTAEEFIRQVSGHYQHIFGFEPDEHNLEKAKKILGSYENIDVMLGGLWSQTGVFNFESGNFGNSHISREGNSVIHTFSIDDFFSGKQQMPTFIKMDIEGAEQEALDGAAEILRRYQPKLAVCVYHNLEDMYMLPQRILHYNPNYALMLRHYSRWYAESVCYGICEAGVSL